MAQIFGQLKNPCQSAQLPEKETAMSISSNRYIVPMSLGIVLLLLLGFDDSETRAKDTSLTQTTFYVY